MIFSPNGAALIFTVACSNLFRSAPLGLFVLEIPKPRALPWADLWLARWAGTQTELHSNAAYWAASNLSDTHTVDDSITTVILRAILIDRAILICGQFPGITANRNAAVLNLKYSESPRSMRTARSYRRQSRRCEPFERMRW